MAITANQNSPFSLFSSKKDETDPYRGAIEFRNHTIVFAYGTMTILRHNVTRVEKYGVKRVYKIPMPLLLISGVFAVIALFGASSYPLSLLITILFGAIVVIGIMERRRPKLSGLTIELNSGYTYSFLNENENAIAQLYTAISDALEQGFTLKAKFEQNNIVIDKLIDKSINSHIGGNAEHINIHGADSNTTTHL